MVKKGAESDEAFVRRVLGKLAAFKDIVVINDEAHHAYRIPADVKSQVEAGGGAGLRSRRGHSLDRGARSHPRTRRIQRCFDLSATPFAPTGKANTEQGLFDWIVSDFGLNDAIEAGLVKTPRVVVRDGVIPDSEDATTEALPPLPRRLTRTGPSIDLLRTLRARTKAKRSL